MQAYFLANIQLFFQEAFNFVGGLKYQCNLAALAVRESKTIKVVTDVKLAAK